MTAQQREVYMFRSVIFRWTLASFWGWFIGFVIMLALAMSMESIGFENVQGVVGIGMGLGVGFMQGRFLKMYAKAHKHWWWVTMLGMSAAFFIWDSLALVEDENLINGSLEIITLLGGFIAGAGQMILLKDDVKNAIWWLPTSAVGWGLAGYTSGLVDSVPKDPPMIGFVLAIGVILGGGAVLGVVTGVVLSKLRQAN